MIEEKDLVQLERCHWCGTDLSEEMARIDQWSRPHTSERCREYLRAALRAAENECSWLRKVSDVAGRIDAQCHGWEGDDECTVPKCLLKELRAALGRQGGRDVTDDERAQASPCPCCEVNAPLNEACVAYEKEIESLREQLAEVRRETIEACAKRCERVADEDYVDGDRFNEGGRHAARDCAMAVRDLLEGRD